MEWLLVPQMTNRSNRPSGTSQIIWRRVLSPCAYISPNCHNHIGATLAETWTTLETAYRQVGISRIYGDFKALVSFRLSSTQHPAAEMEHFNTSLQRLVANGIDLPDNIVRLMYLSSLPSRWDHVAAIYLQGKNNITEITSVGVHHAILAQFERTETSN